MLVGGFVYFFTNLDYMGDRQPELVREKENLSRMKTAHFTELNSTNDEISAVMMERGKLRQREEAMLEKIDSIDEDKTFLVPKIKQLEESFAKVDKEASNVESKLSKLDEELMAEVSRQQPFIDRIKELNDQIEESKMQLADVNKELDLLENNFTKLSNIRKIAHKSFLSSKELLLAEIVRPSWLFFDDQIEVFVDNVSPSDSGFFVREGAENGLKANFLFIASEMEDFAEGIFHVRCKFAEEGLSYFEIQSKEEGGKDTQVVEGQKLYLIRTGDFPIDRGSTHLTEIE